MDIREWALVIFTILSQLAVGAFLVLGIAHLFAQRRAGLEQADRLSDRALLIIGPVLVLGILASLFHLGNPLNAYRAVTNVGQSWLSREVLFSVLFTIAGAIFAYMQWRKVGTPTLRIVVALVAALLGLVQVISMASVYSLRTVPAWNTPATMVSFLATTLLLGSLAIGAALVFNYNRIRREEPDCAETQCSLLRSILRWMALGSIILLGIEMVTLAVQLAALAASPGAGAASAAMLYNQYGVLFVVRLVIVFLGAGVLGLFLFRNAAEPGRERSFATLAYSAFVLVLVAEVVGRFLFYATRVTTGV